MFTDRDRCFMGMALLEARAAADLGEVPVGAVLVGEDGLVLGQAGNRNIILADPSAHAEILALRQGGSRIGNHRLIGATLYVTIEPCVMCAGALVHARLGRLVYGADDPKAGGVVSLFSVGLDPRLNHSFEVAGGLMAEESAALLRGFFKEKRSRSKE